MLTRLPVALVNCRNQAVSQLSVFSSPKGASMSEMAIFARRENHVTISIMSRRTFQAVAYPLFAFFPLTVVRHVTGAAGLPSRLISRFNSSGTAVAWITKSGLLELYLGYVLLIAFAGSATAYLTPRNWIPDFTSWLGLVALFAVMGLIVHSERAVLAQQNSPFSDPLVNASILCIVAMALAWQLFTWTQS
jgi:hypothetical protein